MDNKNKTKIIGFDMDGVIIDHVANKISVSQQYGFKIEKIQTPSDIMHDIIPEKKWDEIQRILFDDPVISLTPKLMPGVRIVLQKLKNKKIPYYLISRRKKSDMALKLLKIKKLWPKYFNESNTFFVKSREEKNIKSEELKITHYFDDQNSVLDKLVSVKNKFLFDNIGAYKNPPTKFSKSGQCPTPNYRRIKSWKEISTLI